MAAQESRLTKAQLTKAQLSKAERRDLSQTALLDAAAELIAERGVEGASLASIAERAGASRGLPGHYFRSKDTLVARLARRAQDGITSATLQSLDQAQQTPEEVSALDLVKVTFDTYLDLVFRANSDQRALIVMWGSTFPSRSSVEGMVEADRRSHDGWAELVERGQGEGSIRTDLKPRATALVLQGLLRGIAGVLMTDPDVSEFEQVRQTCHDWISAALAPPVSQRDQPQTRSGPPRDRRAHPRAS
jgi:AcrR family transcriptional regulator